jgi:ankyrin repeat protein
MSKAAHLETRFLYWAAYLGMVPMVKLFLERKSSPFMRDNKGMNALHTAAYMGHLEVLKLLLDADYTYLEQ